MKVHQPGTDLSLEFSVYCDEFKCDEYTLPFHDFTNQREGTVKTCFVPINEGSQVVVAGFLSGQLLHARLDLLADGSWVGDRMVASAQGGLLKAHNRRRIEFRTVNTILSGESLPDIHGTRKPKVVNAELKLQSLPHDVNQGTGVEHGGAFGVGSLAVIVSLECENTPGYYPDPNEYLDGAVGNWRNRQTVVPDTGVTPTHHLALQNVEDKVITQVTNKFLKRFDEIRLGVKPWAKLVFYYRSKAAILEASCRPLSDVSFPLGLDQLLPMQGEEVEESAEDEAQKEEEPGEGLEEDDRSGLFVTPSPGEGVSSVAQAVSKDDRATQESARRTLGGTLLARQDKRHGARSGVPCATAQFSRSYKDLPTVLNRDITQKNRVRLESSPEGYHLREPASNPYENTITNSNIFSNDLFAAPGAEARAGAAKGSRKRSDKVVAFEKNVRSQHLQSRENPRASKQWLGDWICSQKSQEAPEPFILSPRRVCSSSSQEFDDLDLPARNYVAKLLARRECLRLEIERKKVLISATRNGHLMDEQSRNMQRKQWDKEDRVREEAIWAEIQVLETLDAEQDAEYDQVQRDMWDSRMIVDEDDGDIGVNRPSRSIKQSEPGA